MATEKEVAFHQSKNKIKRRKMHKKETKTIMKRSKRGEREMSKCIVPNWHLEHQRQEPAEEGRNRSSHVQNQQQNLAVPMSNYEVAELTWENGNLAMHGLGGLARAAPVKPAWAQVGDTLESIVHQATQHKEDLHSINYHQNQANVNSTVASSTGKWAQNSGEGPPTGPNYTKKPTSEPGPPRTQQCSCNISDLSAGASASATFCREIDTTALTWTSSDSPGSLKTKSRDEDSALCGRLGIQDEELETKVEIRRSVRRNRAAAIHNQSERRRRDKINQKMKALQKLVPNSSKTDKASMLDEVIEYLKHLQAQLQLMSIRNMPQMMMPLGMHQHHLQMALLARMGMGMGLGMGMGILDMSPVPRPNPQPIPPMPHPSNTAAASAAAFVPPPFMVPPLMATHASPNSTANSPIPMHNPFSTFLTQSMNVDFYNKMAELYRQQVNQPPTQVNAPAAHMNPAQCD